jgi:hypothetical protein
MFDPLPSSIDYIRSGTLRPTGRDQGDAVGDAAGHPDRGRIRAGLRDEPMDWTRCAQEHAYRDHRQAQQGDQRGTSRSQDALADPKMKARLADLGGEPLPMMPADFGKLVAEDTEKWAKVVKFSGAKAD